MRPDNKNIELNANQQKAFDGLKEWIEGDEQFAVLAGYAGTGKTTLLDFFVDWLTSYDKGDKFFDGSNQVRTKTLNPVVTATTNKAVKVLRDKVDATHFMTIHSLLNIKPKKKGTKEVFEQVTYNQTDYSRYDVVIIDECSMISKKLLRIVEDQLEPLGIKVLFVGDPAQLPPINEDISACFEYPGWELTDVVRHSDTISHTAKRVRDTTNHVDPTQLVNPPDIDFISLSQTEELYKGWQDNPDSVRLLCWTNNAVIRWNKKLRQATLNGSPKAKKRFAEGDIVIANKPCFEGQDNIIMLNSQEGEVIEATEQYDSWYLRVRKFAGGTADLKVIKKEYEDTHKKDLSQLAAAKNWRDFWNEKKKYHEIRHAYALTTHKSQGSTFDHIVIDPRNIMRNKKIKERNQLLYVAMTRAAKKVHILQ